MQHLMQHGMIIVLLTSETCALVWPQILELQSNHWYRSYSSTTPNLGTNQPQPTPAKSEPSMLPQPTAKPEPKTAKPKPTAQSARTTAKPAPTPAKPEPKRPSKAEQQVNAVIAELKGVARALRSRTDFPAGQPQRACEQVRCAGWPQNCNYVPAFCRTPACHMIRMCVVHAMHADPVRTSHHEASKVSAFTPACSWLCVHARTAGRRMLPRTGPNSSSRAIRVCFPSSAHKGYLCTGAAPSRH